MLTRNKFIVSFLLCLVLLHQTECNKDRIMKHEDKDRHSENHNVELSHKLENAPIPSIHDGPKVFRFKTRSVLDFLHPIAKRHISQADSLNPQRPQYQRNEVSHQENSNGGIAVQHFHHPGHSSELSSNYPTNAHNYYKIANTYGSAFQYGKNNSFKGYTETTNIGIVPPRGVIIKHYYNSFKNLSQYPVITQHSNGLSLYENRDYPTYGYGYGNRDYVKNAYKNVLTGLARWSILNGLVNGIRYTAYNYTNLPDEYSRNIVLSNDSVVPCFEDAAALCNSHAQPLCINNRTTFCVSSAIVPCDGEAKTCVDISVPCDKCEDNQPTYLPCAANITVLSGSLEREKFNNTLDFSDSSDRNVILCVTLLVIPQKNNLNRLSCDGKLFCLENAMQNVTESNIENTTETNEWKQ